MGLASASAAASRLTARASLEMKPMTKSSTSGKLAASSRVSGLSRLSAKCVALFVGVPEGMAHGAMPSGMLQRRALDTGLLVPVLLRLATVAVGRAARVDHVDVRNLVQVRPDLRHGRVHLAQVARLLGLGVGLVGDADVEVKGRLAQRGQRLAADEPG